MNDTAPTLRNPLLVALWAYGLFVLGNMVLYPHFLISSSYLDVPFGEIASGSLKTPVTILVKGLAGLVLGPPVLFLMTRFLWRRDFAWVGLKIDGRAFWRGSILGLVSAGLVVGLLILLGVGRITGGATRFTGTEVILLLVGHLSWAAYKTLLEEVVFRGMVTREFALRWGWPLAMLLGGLFFAIGHMPGLIPVLDLRLVLTLLVGGVVANTLFVSLFLRCGSLALPWGFHFAWNFVLTGLVGTVMSGEDRSFGLLHIEVSGPPLLTGGFFGPELSIIALGLFVIVTIATLRTGWRGRRELLSASRPGSMWRRRG